MKSNYVAIRLGTAFGLLIGILLITGWLGLSRMAKVNAQVQEITDSRPAKISLCLQALQLSSRNSRLTLQVLLLKGPQEIDTLLAARAANSESISKLLQQIAAKVESREEQNYLDAIEAARVPYVQSYKRMLRFLLEEQDEPSARIMMDSVTLPLLRTYHDAWDAFVQYQSRQIHEAGDMVEKNFLTARRQILALLGLGTLLAIAIAFFVTRSLMREIATRQSPNDHSTDAKPVPTSATLSSPEKLPKDSITLSR